MIKQINLRAIVSVFFLFVPPTTIVSKGTSVRGILTQKGGKMRDARIRKCNLGLNLYNNQREPKERKNSVSESKREREKVVFFQNKVT